MSQRITCPVLLAAASLIGLGCGESAPDRVPVFPVDGTIQSAGRPAANLIVQFHPATPKPPTAGSHDVAAIAAETDDQGRFRLSTYMADDGAPAGDYVVTLRPGGLPELEAGDGFPRIPSVTDDLTRYADIETSPLKATIKAGDNRLEYALE